MKIRAVAGAVVAAMVGITGTIFVGSPASAAIADCTAYENVVCLTENADWTGRVWRQTQEQVGNCTNFGSDFNNKASLAANRYRGSVGFWLYDGANCTGARLYIESWRYHVLSEDHFDNKASSIKTVLL